MCICIIQLQILITKNKFCNDYFFIDSETCRKRSNTKYHLKLIDRQSIIRERK